MFTKKYLSSIFFLLGILPSSEAFSMDEKELVANEAVHDKKELFQFLPAEILEKIVGEMVFAKTGEQAVKNIYALSLVSKDFQHLIQNNDISKELILFILSHYDDKVKQSTILLYLISAYAWGNPSALCLFNRFFLRFFLFFLFIAIIIG